MSDFNMNLQLFGTGAGAVVNGTTAYNTNTTGGSAISYPEAVTGNTLSPTMKTFYDTALLVNARPKLVFMQFAKKIALPRKHGRTIEMRKWNTLPNADALTEGVVPDGKKLSMTYITATLAQYGQYVTFSDLLDLHAVDPVVAGATEELGASAADTYDKLMRGVLQAGTNIMYCDTVSSGTATAVTAYTGMDAGNNRLTPDMVNKAVTALKKAKAPTINGKYIAIIHPSVAYDLRSSDEWIDAHKYAAVTELFNGEIGELHGCRFIETTEAKITEQVTTAADATANPVVAEVKTKIYSTLMFGKDAFASVDPEGGNLEMIIKNKGEIGGPLEQYSTAGYKFEFAGKILYPERLIKIESCSYYSSSDSTN